ncbi:PX domain-containing protein EREX [Punica granatum]|uniref:PX domain-containing protein EREX n=2 Tax=Punica granatum TaxID=22663 RepID=A0A218WA12_PUNGR|nr:PX domain-containing protein EREX [Punica granatum]OWM69615.1 hypothetical protein CDL15_Pgr014076 [Punica granatum]
MDIFTHDLSLFGFNLSDQMMESLSQRHDSPQSSPSTSAALPGPGDDSNPRAAKAAAPASPPPHRHDGKSPLPLGMDWSLPPSKWEGRNTVWPHDPRTGWSYCVTIPSWTILPKSSGSEPVVFYRVQAGIQSPEGVTATHGVLRRFSDFLKLHKELKKEFPMKMLPPTPPKKLLRNKSRILLDERRCSLEDWMEKLLSDIDLSRTATVANFLELEAAARSAFHDINEQNSDWNSTTTDVYPSIAFPPASDPSVGAASPSIMSDIGNDSSYEVSELGSPRRAQNISGDFSAETSEHELAGRKDTLKYGVFNKKFTGEDGSNVRGKKVLANTIMVRYQDEEIPSEADSFKPNNHARRLSTESIASDLSSIRASEVSNFGIPNLFASSTLDHPEDSEAVGIVDSVSSVSQMRRDFVIAFPLEERQKLNRMLTTARQRLSTAKTDMEDIIARFNQEVAVRQFLQTKVKDLEVELETTRLNCNENMKQATFIEKEKFTQMQWDMEELRRKCLEVELRLKAEQEENALLVSEKMSVIQEREMLLHALDDAREQLSNLHKHHEEFEAKSKADVKLLVKEVKSLRSSQSELKHEFSRLLKEKIEVERMLQKEGQRLERADAANAKLLHECEILRDRLQECSVNFLSEEEDKLIVDTTSPSDALDLLTTSDNRIGLLLAEAQLLGQDVENATRASDGTEDVDGVKGRRTDDELRKMLTDTFIDNATLRKQVNSVLRCALNTYAKSEIDEEEEDEQVPLRKTVLSKFLER